MSNSIQKKKVAGSVEASKIHKANSQIVSEEHHSDNLESTLLVAEPHAEIGYSKRRVVGIGNFETVAIEISVKMPCDPKDMKDTFKKAEAFVNDRLTLEVDDIQETFGV